MGSAARRAGSAVPSVHKIVNAARLGACATRLENDLERELDVERFAGADARCADGVADGIGDAPKASRAEGRVWHRVVPAVEEVEHLDAELRLDPLCNGRVKVVAGRRALWNFQCTG